MAESSRFIRIGEIVGTHGIKGILKMVSHSESMEHFVSGSQMEIKKKDGRMAVFTIEWAKPHKRIVLLSLTEITNFDDCQALIGGQILIPKDRLPDLEDGVYYWADLIGLAVYTMEDNFLGRLSNIMPTGGTDVYVVQDGQKEVLIPALESIIREVDLERKVMRVRLPEGL